MIHIDMVQTAVDNAPAESEIRVAEGTYTGVHTVTATDQFIYIHPGGFHRQKLNAYRRIQCW